MTVFFRHMIISGCLIGAVLLTFLLPSREDLGIYSEKHPNVSTAGCGKNLETCQSLEGALGPG